MKDEKWEPKPPKSETTNDKRQTTNEKGEPKLPPKNHKPSTTNYARRLRPAREPQNRGAHQRSQTDRSQNQRVASLQMKANYGL